MKISKLINYSIDMCESCRSTMVAMKCSIFNGNFKEKPKSMDLLAQNNLECPEMYLKDKRIHCEVGNFNTPTSK
jgi:hypothetical protein